MSRFMTIQDFSKRTGVSKSALRYYESVNLLQSIRNESGYRIYTEEQIPTVKLISSLRLAGVEIKEIQGYLRETDGQKKREMLSNWLKTIREQLDMLKISLRYLESYSEAEEIYLIEKEKEKIVWFTAEAEVGTFKSIFLEKGLYLKKLDIPINNCYFIYLSGDGKIKGKLGFGVPENIRQEELPVDCTREELPANVYISLPYHGPYTEIAEGYAKLMNYASGHQWIPTGRIIEWYRGERFNTLDLMMPVTQFQNKGGTDQ